MAVLHLFQNLIEVKRRRFLARRELGEGLDLLRGQRRRRIDGKDVIEHPLPIGVRVLIRPLEWVAPQVKELGQAHLDKGLRPELHRLGPLLVVDQLPVADPERHDLAVVVGVVEPVARAFVGLAGQVGQQVVAVDVDVEGLVAGLVALEQFLLDVRVAGCGQQRGQPLLVGDDAVERLAGLELARPAHKAGHAVGAFPVGVFLAAPGSDRPVRPGVIVRAVVGRVLDDGILGDAQFVQQVEQLADGSIVQHHGVVVKALAADALRLFRNVRPEMHVGGVPPHKEGLCPRRGPF